MKTMKLVTAWRDVRKKEMYVPFHYHDYYELVYYYKGQGRTKIGEESHEYTNEHFVLIPPRMLHDEVHDSDSDLACIGFRTEEPLPTDFYTDVKGSAARIVGAIVEESINQQPGYRDMLEIKLNELAVLLKRFAGKQPLRSQPKSFEYVINYIGENYHEKIQLKEFAEQLNFSYDYFQHHFKELMGVSPRQFLISKRVEAACRMLATEQLSCTEIAYRCGFSNSAQFSAIFKSECGMSPAQYRQSCGESADAAKLYEQRVKLCNSPY